MKKICTCCLTDANLLRAPTLCQSLFRVHTLKKIRVPLQLFPTYFHFLHHVQFHHVPSRLRHGLVHWCFWLGLVDLIKVLKGAKKYSIITFLHHHHPPPPPHHHHIIIIIIVIIIIIIIIISNNNIVIIICCMSKHYLVCIPCTV